VRQAEDPVLGDIIMRAASILPLALVAALGPATIAAADDASVKAAWDSEDTAFTALGRSVDRATVRWEKRGFQDDGEILRLLRRGERLTLEVKARVTAETASTPTGEEARGWALRSLDSFAAYFRAERGSRRAWSRHPSARAKRLYRRAQSLRRRSGREAKAGVRLYKTLGLG
jgi:hypothetical protein